MVLLKILMLLALFGDVLFRFVVVVVVVVVVVCCGCGGCYDYFLDFSGTK